MGITLVAYQLVVLFWLGWEKNMFFFLTVICANSAVCYLENPAFFIYLTFI